MLELWIRHLKKHAYCICKRPNNDDNFVMISLDMYYELLGNEESHKIMDKYFNKKEN